MGVKVGSRWWRLVGAPRTKSPERDLRADLLASLEVVFLALVSVLGMGVLPRWQRPEAPLETPTFHAATFATLAVLVCIGVNRRGHTEASARLFLLVALSASTWAGLGLPIMLFTHTIVVLLAIALFPLKIAAAIGVFALLLEPLVLLGGAAPAELVVAVCINGSVLALGVVLRGYQSRLERHRSNELVRRERWFSTTLSSIGDAVLTTDVNGSINFMNPVAEALTGWSTRDATHRPVEDVFQVVDEHSDQPLENPVRKVLERGAVVGLATHRVLITKTGARRPIMDKGAPIVDVHGRTYGVVLVFRDMTEADALQARLLHSQRLDALGQLAGGVAHDFNNLLTAIVGSADLAVEGLAPQHAVQEDLRAVLDAAERAVRVTGKLLAFSRRQVMQEEAVDFHAQVVEAEGLLRRLLRADIQLKSCQDNDAGWVLVDPVQLQQVIVNLALNAGDAMPRGGVLTLATGRVVVSDTSPVAELRPGSYGRLRVSDTGTGISADVLPHIFEPFFTTKDRHRGTGLGLATVYGITQQSGGAVHVESPPGKGAAFEVFFPSVAAPAATEIRAPSLPPPSENPKGHSIFVVEDDELVRRLTVKTLSQAGYRVLDFPSGAEALKSLESYEGEVPLLLTDVVMLGMSGVEVAERFSERHPTARVLLMSGYADDLLARTGVHETGRAFLEKPFTPARLLGALRALMAAPGEPRV
jgi:PAS domain S-box-containing protein